MLVFATLLTLSAALPVDSLRQSTGRDSVLFKRPDEIRVPLTPATQRPVIDGKLDDEIWKRAQPMTRFVQYEPVDSVLPPQQSVGWVSYDSDHLYVAFRAFEPDRNDIRASVHPRERGGALDDKVAVTVDTYNDNRRTNVFRVSPIGLQFDGVKTEGQRTDDTPDLVWFSAARIDSAGWVAELAIPFASLRLPGGDSLDFGFDFVRYHGKAGVRSSWSPRRRGSPCDICQQGTIIGIRNARVGRTIDFLPYFSGTGSGIRSFGRDSALRGGAYYPTTPPRAFTFTDPAATVGADFRLALTPSSTVNATINPDFSQVESDDEQIRVNQRFALFFQERRPFFLESRDIFDVTRQGAVATEAAAGQLFYTRAIVDPSVGARVTGKSHALQYGVLYAHDDEPAWFSYNGHETSSVLPGTGDAGEVAVARLRADVLSDSWVGVSLLGRVSGESRTSVGAADIALRRGTMTFAAEGGWSHEREPDRPQVSAIFNGETREGAYYRAILDRRGRRVAGTLGVSGLSPGFRNQLGRYSRIGIETFSGRVDFFQYPNGRTIQQVAQSVSLTRTARFGGGQLDINLSPRIDVTFRQRAGVSFSVPIERQTVLGVPLRQVGALTEFRVESSRWIQVSAFLYGGDRELFDPDDPRVTKGVSASVRVTLRPLPQAALEVRGQRSNHFESWGGELVDDAKILRLRGTYQLNPKLGARLIGEYSNQYNTVVSNPLVRHDVRFLSSLLVTYELGPSSFLFLGYNDVLQQFDEPTVDQARTMRTGNQVFLKLSYLFRR